MSLDKAYRLTADVKRVSDQIGRVQADDFAVVVGGAQLSDEYTQAVKKPLLALLAIEGVIASNAVLAALNEAAQDVFVKDQTPVVEVDADDDPDAASILDDYEDGSPEQLAAVKAYVENETGGKVSSVEYRGPGDFVVNGDKTFYDASVSGIEDSPFNQERDKNAEGAGLGVNPCAKWAKGGYDAKVVGE